MALIKNNAPVNDNLLERLKNPQNPLDISFSMLIKDTPLFNFLNDMINKGYEMATMVKKMYFELQLLASEEKKEERLELAYELEERYNQEIEQQVQQAYTDKTNKLLQLIKSIRESNLSEESSLSEKIAKLNSVIAIVSSRIQQLQTAQVESIKNFKEAEKNLDKVETAIQDKILSDPLFANEEDQDFFENARSANEVLDSVEKLGLTVEPAMAKPAMELLMMLRLAGLGRGQGYHLGPKNLAKIEYTNKHQDLFDEFGGAVEERQEAGKKVNSNSQEIETLTKAREQEIETLTKARENLEKEKKQLSSEKAENTVTATKKI